MKSTGKSKMIACGVVAVLATLVLCTACLAVSAREGSGGATTWYVAEGSTAETPDGNFETYIDILNSDEQNEANVLITYNTPEGPVAGPDFILDKQSRVSINVANTVPNEWSVSTRVATDNDVTVERATYFRIITPVIPYFYVWSHASIAVTEPNFEWYLAEGSTGSDNSGFFETWVLVQNPTDDDVTVNMDFMTPVGTFEGPRNHPLEAGSRYSFDVADYVPDEWSVSTRVYTGGPGELVVAERAMYWTNTQFNPPYRRQCAHASIGVTEPGDTWYLAEGSTGVTAIDPDYHTPQAGNFETWVLVQNPGDEGAAGTINFQTPSGLVPGPNFALAPGTRETFNVAAYVPNEWSVSSSVVATEGAVIAERSMYWNNPDWKRNSAHDSIGAVRPSGEWDLPTGRTDLGFEAWVLIQNPNEFDADIAVYFYTENGQEFLGPSEILASNSRKSYEVADYVPDSAGVSARVVSEDGQGVIAEHSVWGSFGQGDTYDIHRCTGLDSIGFPD